MPVLQTDPPAILAADLAAMEVSIVMPCLNEARTVGLCVEKAQRALRELDLYGEVVVADNGSTDGSPEIARANGARVVQVERRGYGSALQAGIAAARGRYVIKATNWSWAIASAAASVPALCPGCTAMSAIPC
jgi:cellulose synthase/poly-beta-1,6-N-acetylglucosamine synthase-like glycosyltransferase